MSAAAYYNCVKNEHYSNGSKPFCLRATQPAPLSTGECVCGPECEICWPFKEKESSDASLSVERSGPDSDAKEKGGVRQNQGKPPLELIDALASEELAKVLAFGTKEYSKHNWRKGLSLSETIGSLERHVAAVKRGELRDPKSGCLHTAHVMANAMFLTRFMLEPERYKAFDDLGEMK